MSETYATIKLAAEHNRLILVRTQPLTAGNSGSIFIELDLRSDDWLIAEKIKLIFNNYFVRTLKDNLTCDIPAEVLAVPGEFEVGLVGISGKSRLNTNTLSFFVDEGAYGGWYDGEGESGEGCASGIYVPRFEQDKLIFELQEEPGEDEVIYDLDRTNEWLEPGQENNSNYYWETI